MSMLHNNSIKNCQHIILRQQDTHYGRLLIVQRQNDLIPVLMCFCSLHLLQQRFKTNVQYVYYVYALCCYASPIRVAPPDSSHEYSNASIFNLKSAVFRCIFEQLITLLKRKIFKTFFFPWAKVRVSVYPRISYKRGYFANEFLG